jgi:hypothetical protein
MPINSVFDDPLYRKLAEQVLRGACDSAQIEVAQVEFTQENRTEGHAWLCFVVDPRSEDRASRMTDSSASDHLALIDPNGFSRNAGSRVSLTVFELEEADEASVQLRDADGSTVLHSPWLENLAVLKALFNVATAY